jgi:hypothetical protein
MDEQNSNNMSLVPVQRSGKAIDAASFVELNNEKIAVVFYEIVKNRLQHVNSWSIIAEGISASFQLVNREGIEVYRKASEGDFIKIDIPGPGSKSGRGFDWVRIEAMENLSNGDDEDSFGFRVRPSDNPLHGKGDTAHFYSHESTSTFIVSRQGSIVSASVFDRNIKKNSDAEQVTDRVRDGIVAGAAIISFSHIQWKNLTNGLVSR